MTVKDAVAELSAVTQTASNAFTATFTADASKTITKDDIKVAAADGSVELAVKEVEYSADGLSAKVTLFGNFTNETLYKITCKEQVLDLKAKVGEVARIAISTASAEQNVETPIEFTLFDADGIDVTPSVSLDTTCYIAIDGTYSVASLDRASKASITMNNVGDKAEVTITYNSNAVGAQDVKATQTIICIDAKAVQGTKLFATPSGAAEINAKSECAKFYLGLSDSSVSVTEGKSKEVYFCAKDSKGDVINYDSYEVESSNNDVAGASAIVETGKFAKIEVTGNTVGNVTLNVTATKNGKSTYYTIPVTVKKVAELASVRVSVDKPTMSNVADPDYIGHIYALAFDKDGNQMSENVSVTCTAITESTDDPFVVTDAAYQWWDGYAGYYTAGGVTAKVYTIKVTASDTNTGKTIERNVSVNVKKIVNDPTKGLKLTYQVEVTNKTVDENPRDTWDDFAKTRLYATYNGLFAGYVRSTTGGAITIADGAITPSDAISDVKVVAKFGTKLYTPDSGLYSAVTGGAITIGANGEVFNAVKGGNITWDPEGKNSYLAKTGQYTVEYRIYTANGTNTDADGNKYTPRTQTFTVKNSVTVPTVTVTSRTTKGIALSDIKECLKASVDMNNKEGDAESVTDLGSKISSNGGLEAVTLNSNNKAIVKYVAVEEDYAGVKWTFYVPINTTFTLE